MRRTGGLHPYVRATEPAVRHLFEGLAAYDARRLPGIAQYLDDSGVVTMSKKESKAFLKAYEKDFALDFARVCLSGAILQIVYHGMKRYAPAQPLTQDQLDFCVKPGTDAAKFCAGRLVRGIPIGLLIFAGRHHYNHWEEGWPTNPVALAVFGRLYTYYSDDLNFDMAYLLDYPGPHPVAHYVVRLELGWRSYNRYLADMRTLLPAPKSPKPSP